MKQSRTSVCGPYAILLDGRYLERPLVDVQDASRSSTSFRTAIPTSATFITSIPSTSHPRSLADYASSSFVLPRFSKLRSSIVHNSHFSSFCFATSITFGAFGQILLNVRRIRQKLVQDMHNCIVYGTPMTFR